MKKETRVGVSVLVGLALAVAVWTLAPAIGNVQAAVTTLSPQDAQTPAAPQSVSGKITAVEKSSFTLSVASEKPTISESPAPPKSMTFDIDANTTIDGKLKVGANADVTYRQEGAKNIAISVRVS